MNNSTYYDMQPKQLIFCLKRTVAEGLRKYLPVPVHYLVIDYIYFNGNWQTKSTSTCRSTSNRLSFGSLSIKITLSMEQYFEHNY